MEVISGAPPAEYGDKTSVIINATTCSGQGVPPHGSVTTSYGSFGSSNAAADLAYGGKNWGNFISLNGLNAGPFPDAPEFTVLHDKGNEETLFHRVNFQISGSDSIHLNLGYTRSWFKTPHSLDAQDALPGSGLDRGLPQVENYGGVAPHGVIVGPTDQRSKIGTFNIAASCTHVLSTHAVRLEAPLSRITSVTRIVNALS
jgi:hypothetical protein